MTRSRKSLLAAVFAFVLVPFAACSSDNGGGGGGTDAKCPLDALDDAKKPVDLTFWHSLTQANEEVITTLTDRFNSAQQDVHVNLVNQTSYEDTLNAFNAGLESGELPDIAQLPETGLQQAIDTQSVLPVQACVDADDYDLSDHLQPLLDRFTSNDTLWAMPFNNSVPVLYYDRAAFRAAGLDPDEPPTTLDEVKEASQAIKESGYPYGYALKIDAFLFEQLMAKGGEEYVDNANGHDGLATEAVFDNDTGREIFEWMADMVDSGLAVTNPRTSADNYFAIGNGQAAMTIDSTGALGTIAQVLGSGQYADVELGVAPMPGPGEGSDDGGVVVGGAALFIVSQSSPEKQAAAWEFTKFLAEPEQAAEFSAGTGYIPTRKSAVDLPVLTQRWAEIPGFRVAYDELVASPSNDATAGAVIGFYLETREVVDKETDAMFSAGKDPEDALADAKKGVDEVLQDYEDQVG